VTYGLRGADDDPREAARARSKSLLGGWYRAEVASAIAEQGDGTWTLDDVAGRVPDVPRSCVNKELNTLLDCDFILRDGKNERGQYLYTTSGLGEYWALGRELAGGGLRRRGRSGPPVVVPIRPSRRSTPRS